MCFKRDMISESHARTLDPAGAWRGKSSDSLPEVFRSIAIPKDARVWSKLGAFSGPGYLVAVGYMDPGNWATDLAGGRVALWDR